MYQVEKIEFGVFLNRLFVKMFSDFIGNPCIILYFLNNIQNTSVMVMFFKGGTVVIFAVYYFGYRLHNLQLILITNIKIIKID